MSSENQKGSEQSTSEKPQIPDPEPTKEETITKSGSGKPSR